MKEYVVVHPNIIGVLDPFSTPCGFCFQYVYGGERAILIFSCPAEMRTGYQQLCVLRSDLASGKETLYDDVYGAMDVLDQVIDEMERRLGVGEHMIRR